MNNFELRKLLTRSIKVSFPEIRDDAFFEIDRDYKEAYFAGRRCNFFREVDNDVSLNFKIRRYRNRFHISGSIQNTCLTGEVREIKVDMAMKLINLKRKESDTLFRLSEVQEEIEILKNGIESFKREMIPQLNCIKELKSLIEHNFGLTPYNNYDTRYTNVETYTSPSSGQIIPEIPQNPSETT